MRITAREEYMDQLVKLGYGNNRSMVMEYLLDRSLDDLLRAKVLTPLSKMSKK